MTSIGPLEILVLVLVPALIILPFWRIFAKAGYPGAFSLAMLVPVLNLIAIYYLAFAKWPNAAASPNRQ